MSETPDPDDDGQPLSERVLDLFVFLPTGLVVTLAEELPRLAERGRERLGVQVNSARAVGKFAVRAGGHELKRRSEGLLRTPSAAGGGESPGAPAARPGPDAPVSTGSAPPRLRSIPRPPTGPEPVDGPPVTPPAPSHPFPAGAATPTAGEPSPVPPAPAASTPTVPAPTVSPPAANVPDVGSLAIPGFDTLSASQVVQRLDGLNRPELVSVRAYETSTRARRTILSRVDQLLDERS